MTATLPETPILTTVPRVELGAVGRWNISNMQNWEPTPDDMASAVAALDCPAVRRPVLKLGHSDGPGDPAIGYIDNMAITDDGQVLVGDYAGIPAWLAAEDDQGNSVISSAYPDRSGEWAHNYVCQLGHTHPFVLHAMALLGVVRPGIGTLQSLQDLYAKAPEMENPVTLASTDGAVQSAATTDDVRRAFYDGPGSDWDLYVREMYIDPPELIVQNDGDGTLTRVVYTIAADGTVTFADPQTVKVQYVTARAASSAPVVAFASHAEARPGNPHQPPSPSASGSITEQDGGSVVDFTPEQITRLRQATGLADENADAEALVSAAIEALAERADPPQPPPPLPEGHVAIPQVALEELRVAAQAGAGAAEQLRTQERDTFLSSVQRKFAPANRTAWAAEYDRDPKGTREHFASAPDIISTVAAGYAGDGEGDPDADPEFDRMFPPTAHQEA